MKKIPVGIKGIDAILLGGLPEGKSILVSGNCGAGKTVFASHFISEGLRNHESALYISLEQEKGRLMLDLQEMGIHWHSHEKKGKLKIIGGDFASLRRLKEKRKAHFLDLVQEITEVVQELKAKRVVIDSLNLLLSLFDNPNEQRNYFAQLNYELQKLGCTVLYTCEVPEYTPMISWFGFEEFVVDGVFMLKRQSDHKQVAHRSIEIIKMRGSGHKEGSFPLRISEKGMEILFKTSII